MKLTAHQVYKIQNVLRRLFTLTIIVAVFVLLRLKGCETDDSKKLQRGNDVVGGSGQEIQNTTLTAYDDTTKVWRLTTDKLIQNTKIKQIIVAPVHLQMYNDSGAVTTTVVSDSGLTTDDMSSFFIWGHVVITDKDGSEMRGKSLSWEKKKRILHSDDYVQISTGDGEVMRGKGFEAAEDFSWWEFKNDVSGQISNFENELGLQDEEKSE